MNNEERQFERALNPEEQHIDALLSNAMAVPMPTGLEERITSASLQQLAEACDQVLEQQLDHAFAIPAQVQIGLQQTRQRVSKLQVRLHAKSLHD